MKQSLDKQNKLKTYKAIVATYRETLDLLSDAGFSNLNLLIENSLDYAQLMDANGPDITSILDVGSGVGLPGIPLAICLPHAEIILTERRVRRAAFLKIVVSQLALDNVTVVQEDVQAVEGITVDAVTAMAVSSLKNLYCWTSHLQAASIILISKKGSQRRKEVEDLKVALGLTRPLQVIERPLPHRGTLVSVQLPGGLECLS